jgi:hypothetical protein
MFLKRIRLISKQIEINKKSDHYSQVAEESLKVLEAKAHDQLSLSKIVNR